MRKMLVLYGTGTCEKGAIKDFPACQEGTRAQP